MKCILGVEGCIATNRKLEINPYQFFIGYQKKSKFYDESKILAMGDRISEILNNDLQKHNLSIANRQWGFKEGIHILCEPCKLIQNSILCIFEISDLNPNVMLEIGKSLYKNIILLRRKDAGEPPSDLAGLKYDDYIKDDELLYSKSAKIANIICDKVLEHNKTLSYTIAQEFFLKEEITKISKEKKFHENLDWSELLEIYDENKIKTAHDYSIIGIAKYKRLKESYLENKITLGDVDEVEKYFKKSKSLNNKIIENYYYLYHLELLRETIKILENNNGILTNISKLEEELDKAFMGYNDLINLINILFNKNLRSFLFIDSPLLIERLNDYSNYVKSFNLLRFLQKNNILNDFNAEILNLLITLNEQSRYEIIGEISRELDFNEIGNDIIERLKKSIEIESRDYNYLDGNAYMFIIDQDLKDKLSYLLGIFGDKRAENVLISLIDNNQGNVTAPAVSALTKINSIKSIPILINLYKNPYIEYPVRFRVITALKILCKNNNFVSFEKIININW